MTTDQHGPVDRRVASRPRPGVLPVASRDLAAVTPDCASHSWRADT